MGHMRFLIE